MSPIGAALITGAAGFIGSHAAARMASRGTRVVAVDNLSRPGANENLAWVKDGDGEIDFRSVDVRDTAAVDAVVAANPDLDVVLHAAGQVAVTSSVANPLADFEANALGTLNVLEAVRHHAPRAAFLFTSTNKVYGALEDLEIAERNGRYTLPGLTTGVGEDRPLDFHSPYGCSKGCADQYVRDYHRIYGLRTVVLRQSCIYGTRQFGVEDQGWVSWFSIAQVLGRPITIYGDGKQVRDVLWIDDLLDLFDAAVNNIDVSAGQVYNIGGGEFRLSLLDLLGELERILGTEVRPRMGDWRPGDQRAFFCDISKARRELSWRPKVSPIEGVQRLVDWARESQSLLRSVLDSA